MSVVVPLCRRCPTCAEAQPLDEFRDAYGAPSRECASCLFSGIDVARPKTRRDCLSGGSNEARPCPFVSCKWHLYLGVTRYGSVKIAFPDIEPEELEFSCALDVADSGGATLEEVGMIANLTRERVRQIEAEAFAQLERIVPRAFDRDRDESGVELKVAFPDESLSRVRARVRSGGTR